MSGIVPWAGPYVPAFSAPTSAPVTSPPSSSLREWWKELRGELADKPSRVQSAVVGLRQNGESAAMGALLAFIDTDLGGLDFAGRLPLDWVGAALFYALSVQDVNPEGLGSDFRAMGQSCTTVAMYRMVHKWRVAKKGISQNAGSGDPILQAKRSVTF